MSKRNTVWKDNVDKRREELLEKGYTYEGAAKILTNQFKMTFTKDAVSSRTRYMRSKQATLVQQVTTKQYIDSQLFPEEVYEQDEEVSFTPEKKRRLFEIWNQFNDGKPKKILSLSDLHAPFIDFNAVEKALKANNDADILMLNGDVFDGHALSDFDKLNEFDIEVEFKQVFVLLDVVTKMFKQVLWVGGNHDFGRFMKFVSRKFGAGMKKYVLKRLNPIEYVAEKYDNLLVVPHDWVEIGKCIFVHPSGYSSALMSTVVGQNSNFLANASDILPEPNYQSVIMGHTHDLGEYYINGVKLIEQGCLCYTMDYRFDRPTTRRWQTGYCVVHLDAHGNVDFNKTRNFIV